MKPTWLSPWLKRPMPLFVYSHFAHDLAPALLVPMLPFIRAYFGLSYFQSGMLISTYSITSGFSQLFMGWIADRVDRRYMVVIGVGGVGAFTFLVGLTQNLTELFIFFLGMGILAGIYHPTATSIFPRYFTPDRRGRAISFHLIGGSAGFMMAPLLGGLIAATAGWRSTYILLAIPAMLAIPFLVREARHPETSVNAAPVPVTTATPSVMRAMRPILFVFTLAVVIQLLVGSVVSFLPVYWVDKHGIAPAAAASLIGLERGGRVLGSLLGGAASDRWGQKQGILISVISAGPLILLIILLPFNGLLIAALALFGVVVAMRQPAIQSLIVDTIPEHRTSTLLGIYFFLALEGRSLLVPLLGYLMDIFTVSTVIWYLAVAASAMSVLSFGLRKKA